MDLPGWERVIGINLTGTMLGMRTIAPLELAPRGIRVNIVHPGPIDTPILDGADPVFVQSALARAHAGE